MSLGWELEANAILNAAAGTLGRGAIWRNPPPLADDCEHDLRCLPSIEFRQTVLCSKCGGLDTTLSVAIAATPGMFVIREDGQVARKVTLERRDPAEATERLRALGMPEDIITEIVGG